MNSTSVRTLNVVTTVDALEDEISNEEARLYNVAPYYRPTKGQHERLLRLLKGSLAIHRADESASNLLRERLEHFSKEAFEWRAEYNRLVKETTEQIAGLRHQIDKLRNNIDKSITGNKIRFRIGKLVILK